MPKQLRPHHEAPTLAFRFAAPVLGAAVVALWQGTHYEDHGWLWAGVFFATVVVGAAVLLVVRRPRLWALLAVLLLGAAQLVALSVWGSVVDWG